MYRDHIEYVWHKEKAHRYHFLYLPIKSQSKRQYILFRVEKEFLVEVSDFVGKGLFGSHLALVVFQPLSHHVQHVPQVCVGGSVHKNAAEAFYKPGATITIPVGNIAWQSGIGYQHVFPGNLLEVILASVRYPM